VSESANIHGIRRVVALVGDCCLVRGVSPDGRLVTHWERREELMPKIPRETIDTAIYLYPSAEDAENCVNVGGSGFLVGIPGTKGQRGWIYAVTNCHVSRECKTIRLNTIDGGKRVLEPRVWIEHPDKKTDLAIASLGVTNLNIFRFQTFMPTVHFVDKTRLVDFQLGVGDDCYMIGRFVNHEGYQRNLPTARFGAIAQMPGEPIWTPWSVQEDAYLVEVRSISGFSGSPVIVRIPASRTHKVTRRAPNGIPVSDNSSLDWHMLLGVDCGHSIDKDAAIFQAGEKEPLKDYEVEYNTGLAIVIPAWKLQEVIDSPEARKMREEDMREFEKRTTGVRLDVKKPSRQLTKPKKGDPIEIPIPTRDEFFKDLTDATRKRDKT